MTTTPVRPERSAEVAQRRPRGPAAVDIARGLASFAVLGGAVLGVPLVLVTVGWPLVPSWLASAREPSDVGRLLFSTPDDGSLLLGVLTAVAWAAWASFVSAVVVEVAAALTGRRARRLPLLAPQQRIAGGLVGAIVVMATAPLAVAAPPAAISASMPGVMAAAPAAPVAAHPVVVVVRSGDTLWGIAQAETGRGSDYLEIAEATRQVVQPDGRRLQDPDRIYPGWTVVVPQATPAAPERPATLPGSIPASPAPSPSASPTEPPLERAPASTPGAGATVDAASPAPAHTTPPPLIPRPTSSEGSGDDESEVLELVLTVGIGALTAAGLLTLLHRRRSRQQRRRRAGQRLPAPASAVREVRRHLSAIQAPATAAHLDRALRHLARECRSRGVALPGLQSVRLVSGHAELHLQHPAAPVSPFSSVGGQDTTWTVTTDVMQALAHLSPEDEPSPYPTLVALGADLDGGEVLVDLEAAGELTIQSGGPAGHDSVDAVAAALTVEMATTPWGEELDVVVVAGDPLLVTALDVERMRFNADALHVAAELRTWATAVRTALSGSDERAERVLDARGDASLHELLRPRVVVVHESEGQAAADLSTCADELRGGDQLLPLTVVRVDSAAGSPEGLVLVLDLESGLSRLDPLGLTLRPHQLDAVTRRQAVEALRHASAPPEDPVSSTVPESKAAQVETRADVDIARQATLPSPRASTPPAAELEPSPKQAGTSPQHPVIAVLGPVEVNHARGEVAEQRHVGSMLEALAYMALHPQRERFAFDQALWPHERVPDARRQQLVSRARRWLGTNEGGAPYVLHVNPDGYRLADAVTTDWQEFRRLVPSPAAASTEDLERALRLVRGQPFSGTNPRRYGWADDDAQEMIAAIVDAAHELATRSQQDGDGPRARRAALKGLLVEPSSEMLWRDALGAEFLSGNHAGLEALTERFLALARDLGDDFEPETEELLKELFSRLPHLDPAYEGARRAT